MDFPDSAYQLIGRALLQNVPAGADFDGFGKVILVIVHREKDYTCLRPLFPNLPRSFKAAQAGHTDIHQHDIGPQLLDVGNVVGSVGHISHNLDIGLGCQKCSQPLAE